MSLNKSQAKPTSSATKDTGSAAALDILRKQGFSISIIGGDNTKSVEIPVSKDSRLICNPLRDSKSPINPLRMPISPTISEMKPMNVRANPNAFTPNNRTRNPSTLNSSAVLENKLLGNQPKLHTAQVKIPPIVEKVQHPQIRLNTSMGTTENQNVSHQSRVCQSTPVQSEGKILNQSRALPQNVSANTEGKMLPRQCQSPAPPMLDNKNSKVGQNLPPDNKIPNSLGNRSNQNIVFPTENRLNQALEQNALMIPECKTINVPARLPQNIAKVVESKVVNNQPRLNPVAENNVAANRARSVPDNKLQTNQARMVQAVSMNPANQTGKIQARLMHNVSKQPEYQMPENQLKGNQNVVSQHESNHHLGIAPQRNSFPNEKALVAITKAEVTQSVSLKTVASPVSTVTNRVVATKRVVAYKARGSKTCSEGRKKSPPMLKQILLNPRESVAAVATPAKKKYVAVSPEKARKAVGLNQLQKQQVQAQLTPKNMGKTQNEPQLYCLQNLSPGLTITPLNPLNASKTSTPNFPAITCKPIQEPEKNLKVVCAKCGQCSRNFTKCDVCKQNIGPSTQPYPTEDTEAKDKNTPVFITKNSIITKQIIYPNSTHSPNEGVSYKQIVSRRSVTTQLQSSKLRPRGKRRYIEPVCLTLSSDDEDASESFSMTQEEFSPPCSEGNKSAASSSDLVYQDCQEGDDLAFPGVMNINEQAEGMEFDDELDEEEEDDEMEMEHEEMENEEIEEEEEEDFDEEVALQEQNNEERVEVDKVHGPGFPICCRSVRIGSFKIHPRGSETYIPIYLNKNGFTFNAPTVSEPTEIKLITLKPSDIISAKGHFGRCLPIIFIFTTSQCAEMLRNVLHMSKSDNRYYDPTSPDEKQKRITFLVDQFTDEHRTFMRQNFPCEKLQEIDQKRANEILVKSTPQVVLKEFDRGALSTIQENRNSILISSGSQQTIILKTQPPPAPQPPAPVSVPIPLPIVSSPAMSVSVISTPVTKILTYPPPPQTGGIPITSLEMACLNEGEFLNDAIIDFYLKYVFNEKLSPSARERTHIFSSYFYPCLTQKPIRTKPGNEAAKTIQLRRHGQVKTWTRHVDIFSKDYIIIPVNQNSHWFLAIICFPGRVPDAPNVPVRQDHKIVPTKLPDSVTSTNDHEASNQSIGNITDQSCSTEGSNQGPEDETASSCDSPPPPFEFEEPPDSNDPPPEVPDSSTHPDAKRRKETPCICIFDSLSGPNRWRIAQVLRDYLDMEWSIKKGTKRIFDRNTMQGFILKCPQQTNYSDCGIYLLQYVEKFFDDPLDHFGSPMPDLSEWFTESCISPKREQLKALILDLQKRQQAASQTQPSHSPQAGTPTPNQNERNVSLHGSATMENR